MIPEMARLLAMPGCDFGAYLRRAALVVGYIALPNDCAGVPAGIDELSPAAPVAASRICLALASQFLLDAGAAGGDSANKSV